MRNLKRTLSLVLAALMLMGMMVVGAGAAGVDDFSDKDEIVNKDAVSMLTILGVINGKEDGSYYAPKDNVTRAEMAKMIATILNQGADVNDLYANLETGLTDIDNSWAKGYINYCYSLGIIAGRGNGTFDPTAPVTGNEAAKMLLVAIGYDPEVEGLTGASWAIKTTSLASTLGIFDDLTAPTAENLNRDNAALLIYNALDVEMIQKYEDGYAMIFDDHRTLLSNKYGVYKVEGIVTANEWAELNQTNSEATAKTGKTTLDHVKVYASTTSNTTVAEYVEEKEPVTFNVSTDVSMLGKAVTMYIKKTTVLANSTVLGVTVDDKVNVIEGTVANSSKVTDLLKGTGLSVNDNTEYYVNYGYESASSASALISDYDWNSTASKFNMNGVDVKLIDNNNDGEVEYVLYIRETLSNVVRTNTKDETVTINVPVVGANGLLPTVTTNKASTTTQVLDNADVVTSMDLAADDLILYVQYGGRTYITEPTIVTGTMTRVDRDQADEQYITVDDGNTYKMSYIREVESQVDADITRFYIENAGKNNGAQFDTKYDFILDSNGYIVAFRPAEDVVANYGLVIGSAWTQNALSKAGEIKILTADSLEVTYDIDWSASVGSDKAFANDTALETYLGTRDVNLYGNTLNAAVGTVIEYSLNENNVLTIKNVLNLNGLQANGDLSVSSSSDQDNITIDDSREAYAYIENRYNATNLQYTLQSKYETGDGYLNVLVNGNQKTFAVDKNTIAFYFDDKDNDGLADSGEYGVATGWENMGDVNAGVKAQVYPVITKSGGQYVASTLADVVLFNAELTNNSANYMLVLNANAVDSKNLELNVVFEDGTTSVITVSKSDYSYFNSNSSFMKAYKYSVNSKGEYTINTASAVAPVATSLLQNGTVDAGGKYLTIVGNTNIWDVTDVDSAKDEVTTGSFDYVNDKWAVVIDTNSGKTLKTAWVWDMDGDGSFGSTCAFDWSLSNYSEVYLTGNAFYDQMNIVQALQAGKNVMVMNNGLTASLNFNLVIPAGLTVQFQGNLNTNGYTVTGAGNLRVYGDYTVSNGNITVPTQVGGALTISAPTTIIKDTHVAGNINVNAATTVSNGVHVCSNGTLYVNSTLDIYGHVQAANVQANANINIYSNNTLLVFGNLEINAPAAVTVGGVIGSTTYTGALTMGGAGTIKGNGSLVVNYGTLTLSTASDVNMTGSFTVNANGAVTQNYAYNKNLSANTIYIAGSINVPGNVAATTTLTVTGTATGKIGGVFTEAGVIETFTNVSSGTGSGTVTGLALTSLKVKGVSANLVGNTASVNLAYSVANDTTVNKFAFTCNDAGATVTVLQNGQTVANDTTAITAGTYTIILSKAGYNSVTYTLTVTTNAAGISTEVSSVAVKGAVATKDSNGNYTVSLTYNQANDTTVDQLVVTTADANATVVITDAGTTGIVADGKGTVAAGTVTITVKAENGTTKDYTITITTTDTGKVKLATGSSVNANVYITTGDTVSSNDIKFTAQAVEGYEGLVVSYQIGNGSWIVLPANADGSYTLTKAILAQAEGQTLTVKAEAKTEMLKVNLAGTATYWLFVNDQQVVPADGKDYIYVSTGSTIKVQVATGTSVTCKDAQNENVVVGAPTADGNFWYYELASFKLNGATLTIG